jgi:hypothetical protein
MSSNADPEAVRAFSYQVALATTGPVLRYSQRLQLLSLANQAGIARFDANLIIAAIENHRGPSRQAPSDAQPKTRLKLVLTAAGVQMLVVLFAWIMCIA